MRKNKHAATKAILIIIIVAYDVILNSFINACLLLKPPRPAAVMCRQQHDVLHYVWPTDRLVGGLCLADDEGFLWISRARNALLLGDYSALPMRDLVIIQRINCTRNSLPFSHTTL